MLKSTKTWNTEWNVKFLCPIPYRIEPIVYTIPPARTNAKAEIGR